MSGYRHSRKKRYHSISDIISAVYCEQKLMFDRRLGDASLDFVRRRAVEGVIEHRRFEIEEKIRVLQNKPGQQIDKRCFIASSIYGIDSLEAVTLRKWRDDVLLQSVMGRMFVNWYYWFSPLMVSTMAHHTWLVSLVRVGLDGLIVVLDKKIKQAERCSNR